jgi:hypothetical protein
MSGAAGGSRINKENLKDTIRDYRDNILKPLGLDKSYSITGVRSRPEKNIFGDIDIVVSFQGGDKKELKQELAQFLSQVDKIPAIPHKKNNKYFIHGNIVSTLYPISGKEGEYVQIDNIVTTSKEEGKFVFNMLDLPAQEQTLAIGLAKTIFTELDEKQIENLFKELNVPIDDRPSEGEEYDFNLNPSELSLRIVPIGKNDGREIWKSNKFEDVKKLTSALGINIEKDKFDDIISKIKKFKNRRSIDRLKGMFAKNIRVGDAEKEIEKGVKKQQALDTVAALEGKYSPLVMSLIKPFIEGETIIVEDENQPKKIIAVFPGKFKPPHKDHIARIKAAANDADEVLVLVSPKTEPSGTDKKSREKLETQIPISADQSLSIFKSLNLPKNVKVLLSNDSSLPVPSPSPVAAAYELFKNNPEQQYIGVFGKEEDFARFGSTPSNTIIKNYDGSAGNLSATDLRVALKNNQDITSFLPDGITSDEYRQALGLDNIDEGDEITSFLDERISFKDLEDIDQVADEELETDVVFNKGSDDHFIRRANERGADKKDLIDFFRELGKSKDEFKDEFEELINNYKPGNSKPAIVAKDEYTGFSIPFVSDNIRKILATTVLSPGMKPKEKKTFSFSEQVQGDSIICDNCGWTWKIEDGGNDLYICHKCGHDNTPQQSSSNNFFEPLQNQDLDLKISPDSSRVDYYKDHIKNVVPSDFKVDKHKDKIVVSNITKKGLEHNKEFKDNLISLTMFMIDNNLNIEPLPSINFIEDDKENANNMLGLTAYYDPNKQCVTLYTYGRHPKDILRSYAHEMIHHKQNLEDRLQHYDGTNINEDDHLKQLEIEAYRDGNIYFRSWENSKN